MKCFLTKRFSSSCTSKPWRFLCLGLVLAVAAPAAQTGKPVGKPKAAVTQPQPAPQPARPLGAPDELPSPISAEDLARVDAIAQVPSDAPALLEPRFSQPKGIRTDISAAIVKAIETAQTEILINAYAITDVNIAQALAKAKVLRGVRILAIMEPAPSVRNYRTPAMLIENNILVAYTANAGFNNNCYLVINRNLVITGSYQFTQSSATSNAENILFIRHPATALKYYRAFAHTYQACTIPEVQLAKNSQAAKDFTDTLLLTY